MVEVQALTAAAPYDVPARRTSQGIDGGRLALLLAVLQQRARQPVGNADVYVSTVGGVRLVEPGLDLAVCLAVVSALTDQPMPADLVVFGEVGLGGELRQVGHTPSSADRGGAARLRPRHRAGQHPERCRRAFGWCARPRCPRRWRWPDSRTTPCRQRWARVAPSSLPSMPIRYSGANEQMRNALARVSPGTPLRDGIDRIVRAKAGALLVLNDEPDVLAICSGGFLVDAPFSPQRLSELAKMDGAIIISTDGGRIARANVHLVPDPTVPTSETGTRHRTAERVARSLDVPVISASEEMGVINVYAGGTKHQLQEVGRLLDRANQALQTLERYKMRLDDAISQPHRASRSRTSSRVRDVVAVVQRGEMVHRIADEIETMIIELGVDARLLRLQLDETVRRDRRRARPRRSPTTCRRVATSTTRSPRWPGFATTTCSTCARRSPRCTSAIVDLDDEIAPKGLRLLHRVHKLSPDLAAARSPTSSAAWPKLQRVTVDDLMAVDGVDLDTAETVKDTLDRVTENTILDQYS